MHGGRLRYFYLHSDRTERKLITFIFVFYAIKCRYPVIFYSSTHYKRVSLLSKVTQCKIFLLQKGFAEGVMENSKFTGIEFFANKVSAVYHMKIHSK